MADLAALFEGYEAVTPHFKVVPVNRGATVRREDEKKETSSVKRKRRDEREEVGSLAAKRRKKEKKKEPDPREGRTVFVGNLPTTCTKKQIKRMFRQYGHVETVRIRSMQVAEGSLAVKVAKRTHKQIGGSSFNAYIVFSSEKDAEEALALNGTLVEGRHVRVDLAGRSREHSHQRSVFVGNLPFSADEEALRAVFSGCGEVEGVRIVRDTKTGVGKGFGFVTFGEKSGVVFALKQSNKLELEGRKVRVFKSREIPSTEVKKKKMEKQQPKFQGLQSAKPERKDFKTQRTRREAVKSKAWKPRGGGKGGRRDLAKMKQKSKSHKGTHPKRKLTPKDNKC